MLNKLQAVVNKFEELCFKSEQPDFYADPKKAAKLLREKNDLEPIVEAFQAYQQAEQDMLDAQELMSDPEMKELCQETYTAAKKAKEERIPCGCPGSACQSIPHSAPGADVYVPSRLTNFPVQIKLLPPNAPCFDGADLLIAADCTAYSYGNFHHDFMQDKVTLIGCPKLDAVDYSEKLTEVFKYNNIRSVTVTRMTVPCCGGLSHAVKTAVANSGKDIPLHIVTISPDGKIIK
jgi:hypothetical protein